MSARALAAAGIVDRDLRASYERCSRLSAQHGRTYHLSSLLLPAAKRPYVHALYAFARVADDIVDSPRTGPPSAEARLLSLRRDLRAGLARGRSHDPILRAVVDTVLHWQIPIEHIEAFLASMAMDLTVTEYATWEDLQGYTYGSAAVIGLQMLPILGPLEGRTAQAAQAAQDLGTAFQLANFVRDVGEDLDRGRVYLPLEDLARFGLERGDLERRVVDDPVRDLLAFQVARVRRLEARARPGIDSLEPTSRPCIDAARILYCGIVDEVERHGFQVFDRRAAVPVRRRFAVAGRAWLQARLSPREVPLASVGVPPSVRAAPRVSPRTPTG